MVTMFSEYCAEPFTVEPVDVVYEDGAGGVERTDVTPALRSRAETAAVAEICGIAGVPLAPAHICELCNKMQLGPASHDEAAGTVTVHVPPTRSDIMHAVDVAEDVAIAYGFNKIMAEAERQAPTNTTGKPQPINHFGDLLRLEIARAGYTEVLTHGLCSVHENFTSLRRPVGKAVALSNPVTVEYEVVRTTLLPGLLKTLRENRAMAVKDGIKLFEISDVVLVDPENDVGARNSRRVCALYAGLNAGFEVVHGLLDRIMTCLAIAPTADYGGGAETDLDKELKASGMTAEYTIAEAHSDTFFPGRCAEVKLIRAGAADVVIGQMGILHPAVLEAYGLEMPVSVFEIDMEALM